MICASCGLPRDPEGTLDRVQGGIMRVGYAIDTPWVTEAAPSPGGVEAEIASDIARTLNARIVWIRQPESDLMHALAARELDLVIAGLTEKSAWSKESAFTRSYYTDTIVVANRAGTPAPPGLKGTQIGIHAGDAVAAEIRKKDGTPVNVREPKTSVMPVAMPAWQVQSAGRENTGIVLSEDKHVLAVTKGENAWLVKVEQVLREIRPAIPAILRRTSG